MQSLALALAFQILEPIPAVTETGEEVEVAVRADDGRAVAGVLVRAQPPAGAPIELGLTGADGALRFRPQQVGAWMLRAELPPRGVVLAAPLRAVPRPRRWVYILVCVPAGAALLWWNLRRVLRREPSPPAP